jgi:hypothetical protein
MMSTRLWITSLSAVSLVLAGCGGGAAGAVESAEREIARVQEQAAKIAPDRLQALSDSLAAFKSRLGQGDDRAIVLATRTLVSQVRDLVANLETTKQQLTGAFSTASSELPRMLETVLARISELAAMRRLPPTVNAERFSALQAESAGWSAMWGKAQEDFNAGNLAAAMSAANTLRAKLRDANSFLGL